MNPFCTLVLPGRLVGNRWCVSRFQQSKEHGLHRPHVSHDGEQRSVLHRDAGLLYDVEIGRGEQRHNFRDLNIEKVDSERFTDQVVSPAHCKTNAHVTQIGRSHICSPEEIGTVDLLPIQHHHAPVHVTPGNFISSTYDGHNRTSILCSQTTEDDKHVQKNPPPTKLFLRRSTQDLTCVHSRHCSVQMFCYSAMSIIHNF